MGSLPVLLSSGAAWRLRDTFATARAAGSLGATPAEPGPGVRTVSDAESKLSAAGGELACSGGKAVPAYGDPGIWWPQHARAAGRVLLGRLTKANTSTFVQFGWDADASSQIDRHGFHFDSSGQLNHRNNAYAVVVLGVYAAGTTYGLAQAMRANGAFALAREGAAPWRLMYVDDTSATACVPGISVYNAPFTADDVRIPVAAWLPEPLVSDGFGGSRMGLGSSDGLGHPEGVAGGVGSGGAGQAWTEQAGTWGVSGGAASCPALAAGIGQAAVALGTSSVFARVALTRAGGACGLALRAVDASHCVKVCHDGTSVTVVERSGGVDGAPLLSVAKAFGAGVLMASLEGTALRVFWNNSLVGAVTVGAPFTSPNVGLHTTHAGNGFDGFTCWARGLEGQYAALEAM